MAKQRPQVLTRCVADKYHLEGERIVEVSSRTGGCLISIHEQIGSLKDKDKLVISIYRDDPSVRVVFAGKMHVRKGKGR